jgi:hypothetical protein
MTHHNQTKKSSGRSSIRRKNRKANKRHKKSQTKEKRKKMSNSRNAQNQHSPWNQTLPNTLNASSPPWIDIIIFLLSTTLVAKSPAVFVPILSTFGNELIKHKLREERDVMHEIQNYGASQGIQVSI